jgi:hypothetical protein
MPKDVTVEEDIQGWYYYNNEPYLTKSALKKELHLSDEQLQKVVRLDGGIKDRTVVNKYRIFEVYCLEDVKSLFNLK